MDCPRCLGTAFRIKEWNPPGEKRYTARICQACGLYHSGKLNVWLTGSIVHWTEESPTQKYSPDNSYFTMSDDTLDKWVKGAGPYRDRMMVVKYLPMQTCMPVFIPIDKDLGAAKKAWPSDKYEILGTFSTATKERID